MRKDLSAIGLGMVLSSIAAFSALADPSPVKLHGHVPAPVAHAQARAIGRLASQKDMQVFIGLPLRNREALTNLLREVSDPSNPKYGHYLTPQQFTESFGPTEQDYQAVIDFAQKHKLNVVEKHPNRVILTVNGKVSDIEKTFGVTLRTYEDPDPKQKGRVFFAPDTEPTVDGNLAILQISGLDDYALPRSSSRQKDMSQQPSKLASGASPALGTGPFGSFQGKDFRNAYVPGTTLAGAGQSVGLLQFDDFFASDIAAYANQIGLASVPNIVVVPVNGGVQFPNQNGGNAEVSLDIEMVLSMSPGVSNIYVYEAAAPPFSALLNRMANDNLAKQLSSSWFIINGPPDPVSEQIFQQMALQGQTFFEASGDADAYPVGGLIPFPSDSPHITLVGGTTLSTGAVGSNYVSETVWNWGITFGLDGVGSGGGISTFYTIPSWQTNINMPARGGSSLMRNVPDVALTADNVWVIFGGGQSGAFGGTSCAAPLWAGFTALVNQLAAQNSRPPVGFINPAVYAIGNSANYTNCFHDTTVANNTWSGSPNLFFATNNYDLCTGLGTPNGTNLINALVAIPNAPLHISPPPPPYGTNMAALKSGTPNGTWSLFVQDDAPISSGYVSNGWILSLTTADIVGTVGDLELLMRTTNSATFSGRPVTFFLTVTNYGPSISTNVTVVDDLPLTVTVSGTNATQGSVSRAGSTVIWNVGTLNVNAGAGLALTVTPHTLGTLLNTAIADAGTPDPNPDEDSASASIDVVTPSATLIPSFNTGTKTFQINVPGPTNPAPTVVIQAGTNLVSTNWVSIYTGVPPFIVNDTGASNYVTRFYRAVLLP